MEPNQSGTIGLSSDDHPSRTLALTFGSVGVVYGDIGTSPIYAFRESLHSASRNGIPGPEDVISIVSLLLWLLIVIATAKYVIFIHQADKFLNAD